MTLRLDVTVRHFRPHVESERNLVLSTWLRSESGSERGKLLGPAYYSTCEPWLRETVIPRSRIYVAALPADDDAIVGWLATERGAPLALVVKHAYSSVREHVETQLLNAMRGNL